ncbi:MAG: hypothetical protein LBS31_12835 [Candidatus Adiutrix sp.]|jgi:hypothetical protein|nr:hypothetical protein [Candidatus Adiutrix sp.]
METPQPAPAVIYEVTVSSILIRAWSTLFQSPGLFFGLAALSILPTTLITTLTPLEASRALGIADRILTLIIQGAMTYAVYPVLCDEEVTFGESLSGGLSRLWPLCATSLLTSLGIGLGLILLVIPGLILACAWSLTIPACVVEELGPVDSIKRSAELTKGHRLTIVGAALPPGILLVAAVFFAAKAEGAMLASLAILPFIILFQAFMCVMIAVIYFDLRANEEGVAVDSLANVFD